MTFTRNFDSKLSMTREMNKLLKRGYKVNGEMVKGVFVALVSEDDDEMIILTCKA